MEKYIFELIEIKRKDTTSHQQSNWKECLYSYPSLMSVGVNALIPIDNGRVLRTSVVKKFELDGNYMVIETDNTVYTFRK
ncbi:MAG: hypothetical protein ACRCZ9_03260 [Fusobacteriaceae bacterium]